MHSIRTLFSGLKGGVRKYAQVHDITIKADNRIVGSMERNGTFYLYALCFGEDEEVDARWDAIRTFGVVVQYMSERTSADMRNSV
jgi:hypothetical protein